MIIEAEYKYLEKAKLNQQCNKLYKMQHLVTMILHNLGNNCEYPHTYDKNYTLQNHNYSSQRVQNEKSGA